MYSAAEPVLFKASGSWSGFERRLGGAARARALFCCLYLAALWLDHELRYPMGEPAVLRPSVGLLVVVLWFTRPLAWPVILAIHLTGCIAGRRPVTQFVLAVLHAAGCRARRCRRTCRRAGLSGADPRSVADSRSTGAAGDLGFRHRGRGGAVAAAVIDSAFTASSARIPFRLPFHWGELVLGALSTGPLVVLWSQARPAAHRELLLRSRRSCWRWPPVWSPARRWCSGGRMP